MKTCTQLSIVDLQDKSHHKQRYGLFCRNVLEKFRKLKFSENDVLGIRILSKAALITLTENVLLKITNALFTGSQYIMP